MTSFHEFYIWELLDIYEWGKKNEYESLIFIHENILDYFHIVLLVKTLSYQIYVKYYMSIY